MRHAAHDGSADAESPVGVLIEAQHLSGEGHAQGQEQKKHSNDPGQFAGKLVRPEHEDLHHVDEHDGDHEIRAPSMQRAQKPAQRNIVVEELEAVPRLARGRRVNQRKQNAGHDLQHEQHRGGAAKDIPPACAAGRNGMRRRVHGRLAEAEAMLEPVVHSHAEFSQTGLL